MLIGVGVLSAVCGYLTRLSFALCAIDASYCPSLYRIRFLFGFVLLTSMAEWCSVHLLRIHNLFGCRGTNNEFGNDVLFILLWSSLSFTSFAKPVCNECLPVSFLDPQFVWMSGNKQRVRDHTIVELVVLHFVCKACLQ